jgi:hypothetical protein
MIIQNRSVNNRFIIIARRKERRTMLTKFSKSSTLTLTLFDLPSLEERLDALLRGVVA